MSVAHLSALYEQLLTAVGLDVDTEGKVSVTSSTGQTVPMRVAGRNMFVPTETALRTFTEPQVKNHYIAFHPLSESILRTQSPVIKWFRQVTTNRLAAVIAELLTDIIEIAADHSRHAGVHPKATEFLGCLTDADTTMVSALKSIIDKVDGDKNKLINIYLKQGGKFDGKAVQRSANVSFPILEELDSEAGTVFGVKLRKKDRIALKKFFLTLLPGSDDPVTYSYGSSSSTAPYFHALLCAFQKVATRLNTVTKLFAKNISFPENLHIELDWAGDLIDNIGAYRETIPPLSGNEGETKDEVKTEPQQPMVSTGAYTGLVAPAPQQQSGWNSAPTVQVNPMVPTVPGLTVPGTVAIPQEYKPFKGLGITMEDASKNPLVSKQVNTNDGGDLEMMVLARNSGFGDPGVFGSTAPAPQIPTNYPWLPNYQPQQTPGINGAIVQNGVMYVPVQQNQLPQVNYMGQHQTGFQLTQPQPQTQFAGTVSSI